MTGSTRAQIIMRNATLCDRQRDFQATRRYVWSPLSVAVLMNDEANGGKWAAGPILCQRTALRLSEAVFWDFPLTPRKVRTEQEQKAEQKTLQTTRQEVTEDCCCCCCCGSHASADRKRQKVPRCADRIVTPLSQTINQTTVHAQTLWTSLTIRHENTWNAN